MDDNVTCTFDVSGNSGLERIRPTYKATSQGILVHGTVNVFENGGLAVGPRDGDLSALVGGGATGERLRHVALDTLGR